MKSGLYALCSDGLGFVSLLWRLRFKQRRISMQISENIARAPMTMPAIAPAGSPDECVAVAAAVVLLEGVLVDVEVG